MRCRRERYRRMYWIYGVGIVASAFFLVVPQRGNAAPSHNVTGFAWSREAEWISMNGTNCFELNRERDPDPCVLGGVPEAQSYGVTISETGLVTGYAWSRRAGWICFGSTCMGSGGAAPSGGWGARVNAITGEVTGWAKVLALGNGGWISLSCTNTDSCAASAYRTQVSVATGRFSGHAWNGAQSAGASVAALGWISWSPAFGGVVTSWRPVPRCSIRGEECQSDIECGLPGERCCLGGAPCGRCEGVGAWCAADVQCPNGVLCCPEGAPCGQCVDGGAACGGDDVCIGADGLAGGQDSCCPPGAICSGGRSNPCNVNGICAAGETPENCPLDCGSSGDVCNGNGVCEAGESIVNCPTDCGARGGGGTCNTNGVCEVGESARDCEDCTEQGSRPPIGSCAADLGVDVPRLCVGDAQCGSGACDVDLGICEANGRACQDGADCGAGSCDVDVGIRTDTGTRDDDHPDGVSVPCANDDPNCRRVIGRCTNAEQLCAVDGNCPAGGQCGRLFLPWVQTQFGSIYSSGKIGSSRTAPPPAGHANATYCIFAGVPPIVNFLSESGCGNIQTTPYPSQGSFALPTFPNYLSAIARIDLLGILSGRYGLVDTRPPSLTALVSGFQLRGRVYAPDGDEDYHFGALGEDVRLVNGTRSDGSGLLILRGRDLYIDSDIIAESGRVSQVKELASFGILVLKDIVIDADGKAVVRGGNIFIHPSVQSLAGAFYAEEAIHTCAPRCTQRDGSLTVRGIMVARKFFFERLYASAEPAEHIISDGRVLANPPPGFEDLTRSLPTITQTIP